MSAWKKMYVFWPQSLIYIYLLILINPDLPDLHIWFLIIGSLLS